MEEPPTEDIPQDEVPKEDGQEVPPDVTFDPDGDTPKRVKYYVNDVPVSIINERVQYLDADGKLITESLVDYTRKNIRKSMPHWTSFCSGGTVHRRNGHC